MAETQLEKARDFLAGVATGDPDLATRHVDPDRFAGHGPLAADSAIALFRRVDDFPKSTREVQIVRILEDGQLVVVQHAGVELGRMVAFEVFRFDLDLIVEHWAFTATDGTPNKSGHTQADGPTKPCHHEDTEKNKAGVRDYYDTVHLRGRHEEARRWFPSGTMIRHEPNATDGGEEFLRDLALLTHDRTIDTIELLAGEGDFVFLIARGTFQGEPCAYVDLYRTEEGKLAEHWGFPERM